jgi:hypothetical protein
MNIAPVSMSRLLIALIRPVATKAPRHEASAPESSAHCGDGKGLRWAWVIWRN